MKVLRSLVFLFALVYGYASQAQTKIENLIIVTTDGLRWQEVFNGMDTALAASSRFNQGDSSYIFKTFYAETASQRREKLFPFIWGTLAKEGQIYGNRQLGNKVDNANQYRISYPGYSELLTGYVDTNINSNGHPPNPNVTVLEFINSQPKFKNKVAAFGAWNAFDRIINEERAGFPVISAYDHSGGNSPTENQKLLNKMLADSHKPWHNSECLDVFTHYAAFEQLKSKQTKVLYIAYGETDEWAHAGQYRHYLDAAHQVDQWLNDLWKYVQENPKYKNKTALLITVDHGRGDKNINQWTEHGSSVQGASETWFGLIAPGIKAKGEMKQNMQLYQKQLAQTMASLLDLTYKAEHPVAGKVNAVWEK